MTLIAPIHLQIALAAIAIASAAGTAPAATRYVSPCGQDAWAGVSPVCSAPLGPKRTIQAAIDSSVAGDQISVLPGAYVGAMDLNGKAIHILGVGGPAVTIVDGNGAAHTVICDGGESAACVIEGLRIAGGDAGAGSGGGVRILFSSPTFIDCQVLNNEADLGGGVSIALGNPTFTDCVIAGNYADAGGGGVYCASGNPTFVGCEFLSNTAISGGGGGALFEGGNATIDGCQIHFNDAGVGGGVDVLGGSLTVVGSTIDQNESEASGGGLHLLDAEVTVVDTDVFENIAHTSGGGIAVAQGAILTIDESTISGNVVNAAVREPSLAHGGGIRVYGGTLVGTGLVIAGNGTEYGGGVSAHASSVTLTDTLVWLNAGFDSTGGLLAEASSQIALTDVDVVANDSPVAGGISVQQASLEMTGGSITNHASYAAAALSVFESAVDVEDVTIEDNVTNGLAGVGVVTMAVIAEGDAVFDSCDFIDNIANIAGGAVYMTDAHAHFAACVFTGNSSSQGGAIAADNFYGPNTIALSDCIFHANVAGFDGGAMSVNGDTFLSATATRFSFNEAPGDGGAIYAGGAEVHLVHCDLYGNTADNGAGLLLAGTATNVLTGCRITSNVAIAEGGAMRVGASVELLVTNCTVTGNTASTGSAISTGASDVDIANSIVWGNSGVQVSGSGEPQFRYSIIPLFQDGPGCFTADPQFVNAAVGNYRLAAGSPAIEAGTNTRIPFDVLDADGDGNTSELLPVDRDGDPRVQLGASSNAGCEGIAMIDLGAYEVDGDVPAGIVSSADLNDDGIVNGADLALLLGAWGPCSGCCIADLNADGAVGGADLAVLLGGWG